MSPWQAAVNELNAAAVGIFGKEVLYLPETGGQVSVRAVLEEARQPDDTTPGVWAVLFVRVADLPAPPVAGDELEIDGARYKVDDIAADSEGGVILRARRRQ
jgi:hypothetical protein